MDANVNAILSPEPVSNFRYKGFTASMDITEKPVKTCYFIKCVFHNQVRDDLTYTDPETKEVVKYFEFEPIKIDGARIEQKFTENFLNHYEIKVTLTVQQYLLLYYNYKDLKCNLKLYAADGTTGVVTGIDEEGDPILTIDNAFCIFKNKQDIIKKIPKESIIPERESGMTVNMSEHLLDNVSFQLIPKEDYNFKCARINAIFRDCTLHDAIWTMAEATKAVEAIMLVNPDNGKKYKNLVIPPVLTMPEMFTFLQRHYGLYNKGMSFFYEFGILYIYPLYETAPVLPKDKSEAWGSGYKQTSLTTVKGAITMDETGDGGMTHIYAAGESAVSGNQYYHGYEKNTIHIVANGKALHKDLADDGVENIAYGYIIQHADRVVDDWRVMLEAEDQQGARYGIYQINIQQDPNNEYLVDEDQNKKIGFISNNDNSNLKFEYDGSNRFEVQARLQSYRRSLVMFEWNMAVPFTFRPGYKIMYHFDYEDPTRRDLGVNYGESVKYTTKSGTVEDVTYIFEIANHLADKYILSCKATTVVSLAMDETDHVEGV